MPISMSATLGGGGGGGLVYEAVVTSSRVFTAPIDADYIFTAVGGGGSGGSIFGAGRSATGGGAGGFSQKKIELTAGATVTITIGAGGAGVLSATNAGTVGEAGSATTVVGTGINLSAGGGGGGQVASGATTATGGVGGVATGGDVNFTGGGSGTAQCVTASGNAASGGGAVAVFGVGYASGDAIANGGYRVATGGAGVGGRSGSATGTTARCVSEGGSSIMASANSVDNGGSFTQTALSNAFLSNDRGFSDSILRPSGSSALSKVTAFPGGGAVGHTSAAPDRPGSFAGGGASNGDAGLGLECYAGGGSGAMCAISNAPTSGKGGDGLVVIQWSI